MTAAARNVDVVARLELIRVVAEALIATSPVDRLDLSSFIVELCEKSDQPVSLCLTAKNVELLNRLAPEGFKTWQRTFPH